MPQTPLEQVIHQIRSLKPEELRQVIETIRESLLSSDEASRQREAFHEALLTSGLVKRIARRSATLLRKPLQVHVEGKPISETLIEERR
jgi:hypothetical protein